MARREEEGAIVLRLNACRHKIRDKPRRRLNYCHSMRKPICVTAPSGEFRSIFHGATGQATVALNLRVTWGISVE